MTKMKIGTGDCIVVCDGRKALILENLGDREMVFMTVEFKDSANKPMALPAGVRPQAAA